MVLLTVTIAVFSVLVRKLKQNFPELYVRDRTRLLVSGISIIISIIVRIAFIGAFLSNQVNKAYIESLY